MDALSVALAPSTPVSYSCLKSYLTIRYWSAPTNHRTYQQASRASTLVQAYSSAMLITELLIEELHMAPGSYESSASILIIELCVSKHTTFTQSQATCRSCANVYAWSSSYHSTRTRAAEKCYNILTALQFPHMSCAYNELSPICRVHSTNYAH